MMQRLGALESEGWQTFLSLDYQSDDTEKEMHLAVESAQGAEC